MESYKYILIIPFICLSAFLFIRFFYTKQKEKEPLHRIILAVFLGGLFVVIAYYSELFMGDILNLPHGALKGTDIIIKAVFMILFVGFIEELSKLLAALPIYLTKDFNRVRDGLFYMALTGLGFGLVEDFIYVGRVGFWGVILRLSFGLLFHPAASGLIGYYIGKAKFGISSLWKVVFVALGVMLLHGVYDMSILFGSELLAPIALAIAAFLYGQLFILYGFSEKKDRELGVDDGSTFNFCPRCGKINNHNDFCVFCGKKLFKEA